MLSTYIAKYMNIEKSKRSTFWNGGSMCLVDGIPSPWNWNGAASLCSSLRLWSCPHMRHYQSICSAANVKPSPHLPCNTIILSYVALYPNLCYSSISRTCASTETHWTIDPASSQGYVLIKANRPPILLLISRLPQELWTLPFVDFFFQSSIGLQYLSNYLIIYLFFLSK